MRKILVALILATGAFSGGSGAGLFSLQSALAAPTPPSTLTGETFTSSGGPVIVYCNGSGNFTFTASGVASGPYAGTFTETGSGTVTAPDPGSFGSITAFSASFTIYSPTNVVLVTGTKTLASPTSDSFCYTPPNSVGGGPILTSYQATIYTATGKYRDQGSSTVGELSSGLDGLPSGMPGAILQEDFTSSLLQTTPTSKDQCKDGGYKNLSDPRTGQPFKNQGQCVDYVNHLP